jgi:hypothetical protein
VNNLPGAAATFAQLLRWDTDDDQHQLRSDGGATDDTGVVFFCGMGTIEIPEGLWRACVAACARGGTARIPGVHIWVQGRCVGGVRSAEFDNGGVGGSPIFAYYKSVFICSVYSILDSQIDRISDPGSSEKSANHLHRGSGP